MSPLLSARLSLGWLQVRSSAPRCWLLGGFECPRKKTGPEREREKETRCRKTERYAPIQAFRSHKGAKEWAYNGSNAVLMKCVPPCRRRRAKGFRLSDSTVWYSGNNTLNGSTMQKKKEIKKERTSWKKKKRAGTLKSIPSRIRRGTKERKRRIETFFFIFFSFSSLLILDIVYARHSLSTWRDDWTVTGAQPTLHFSSQC